MQMNKLQLVKIRNFIEWGDLEWALHPFASLSELQVEWPDPSTDVYNVVFILYYVFTFNNN